MNISDNRYILRWAKKIRAIRLLGGCCNKCQHDDIFSLQFHHVKDKTITDHLFQNKWGVVEKEIMKCKLLCANCHCELHYTDNGILTNEKSVKDRLLEIKGVSGCERCGYKGISNASLHFHHIKPVTKSFEIGNFSHDYARSGIMAPSRWIQVLEEIEKCEVLCARCHLGSRVDLDRWKKFEMVIMDRVCKHHEKQSKVDREVILKMFKDGGRVNQIARKIGCSNSVVSRAINEDHI